MLQETPELVELQAGPAMLAVSPMAGGSITRYASQHDGRTFEWMRPALPGAVRDRSAGSASSFPLVPFSNRIRNAAFRFRGRVIQLPQNFQPEPHAIHGHGWRAPWAVTARSDAGLTLEYRHPAGAWPWSYRAEQTFRLTPDNLAVRFAVTNDASEPMPVGFGLHPYFVRTPQVRLRAAVGQMWRADANAMPAELVAPPPELASGGGGLSPDATVLDNNFVGFTGRAVIEWPEWGARLAMTADPVFACLVVYTPAGRDFFCVEPATNCIDGFNLADDGRTDTGLIVLEPGDTAVGNVTFTPTTGA
jgi:aldose 1-epimerase